MLHFSSVKRRTAAFTLVEIMIVVAIIALLAAIALPSFLRARQQAQNTKFISALRVATDAIQMFAMEHHRYPADVNRGIIPPRMATYLDQSVNWTGRTPLGGQWDWDFNVFGVRAAICLVDPSATIEQLLEVDRRYDDGNLQTGRFREIAPGRYGDIIEQ
jgi:prepilin-type N-terminal cleavage/methylation domain-containing protein